MTRDKTAGSISLAVLVVLLALSIIVIGAASIVTMSTGQVKRIESRDAQVDRLRDAAVAVTNAVAADPTPEAQAQVDPFYQQLRDLSEELKLDITLDDLSGRLGVNWVRKELLDGLGLLLEDKAPDEFQQHREDIGFRLDIARSYGEFFDEKTLAELFTPHSYWNLNISDEFTLEGLCALRTGDAAEAEEFRSRIQELRIKDTLLTSRDLAGFLGDQHEQLAPVLTVEAPLNINYVDEILLNGLFRYFEAPASVAERIRSVREKSELTDEWLHGALKGIDYNKLLLQYVGVKSWFWKMTIEDSDIRLEWILCRTLGRDEEAEGMEIRLIQESLSRVSP